MVSLKVAMVMMIILQMIMMVIMMTSDVCGGQDWVVLGAVDLDQFVQDNLVIISDWERNFRALKARGRDAEKLPR